MTSPRQFAPTLHGDSELKVLCEISPVRPGVSFCFEFSELPAGCEILLFHTDINKREKGLGAKSRNQLKQGKCIVSGVLNVRT